MATKFKFRWFMGHAQDATVFARLWSALQDPFIEPKHFDWIERARKPFTADPEPARLGFSRGGTLFVTGARDRFMLFLSAQPRGLTTATVYLTYKKWDPQWLAMTERLFAEQPILYALAATQAEYDHKHKVVEEWEGGSSKGAVGISIAEFYKYLPGVYWTTWFGPPLAELDFAAASAIPGVDVRTVGTLKRVQITEPPETDDLAARAALEARIADALGERHFFDRNRMDRTLQQVPAMLTALTELDKS